MEVYITRHGRTDWNNQSKCQGLVDIELNEEGRTQARNIAHDLKSQNVSFDLIYSSPLKRAYETACIISENMNSVPVLCDPRLIERSLGIYEGKTFSEFDFYSIWDYYTEVPFADEELMRSCFERAFSFLNDLIHDKNLAQSKILIVTHFGMSIPFEFYPDKPVPSKTVHPFGLGNCIVKKII